MDPVFEFIDRSVKKEKPFFIWYAPFLPTLPHNPPERLHKKYLAKGVQKQVAQYYAMCEWFDETCRALMNHIDQAGIAENTLVVYVTDNGWIQTENGGYGPRSKRSPYEGGTRNPIMFRWKGTIPPADRPELCSSLDFVPTVLAAAGAADLMTFGGSIFSPISRAERRSNGIPSSGSLSLHDIAGVETHEASFFTAG